MLIIFFLSGNMTCDCAYVLTVLSGVPIVSMICYIRLFDRSKITVFVILFGGLQIYILFSNGDKHSRLMQNIFY